MKCSPPCRGGRDLLPGGNTVPTVSGVTRCPPPPAPGPGSPRLRVPPVVPPRRPRAPGRLDRPVDRREHLAEQRLLLARADPCARRGGIGERLGRPTHGVLVGTVAAPVGDRRVGGRPDR